MIKLALCVTLVAALCDQALAHGRMMEPPARNSMWRVGFKTPRNYCDHCLNCGNKTRHLDINGGKCGLCGDPYDGARNHEAGGKNAPVDRPIARCYQRGLATTIPVSITITAYHKGYFEFHMCENNDLTQDPGNECFDDANLLTIAGTNGETKFDINGNVQRNYNFSLVLPNIECAQCILRWEYTTGNGWGCEEGKCGLGLGAQEQFINCADVAVLDDCTGISTAAPANQVTNGPIVTKAPATSAPNPNPGSSDVTCRANQIYRDIDGMNDWCQSICREPLNLFCPQTHCICD